ncbi:prepilin-type N-terminal cleavage/methylation domain-containing protein [Limnohabitans sp. DCL3]|uniref:prepilin-type N-terminal cleavage/methylation domain-containing protein n=1 Tax=Limnohabitans sp. DCL3 TaxID=3374103 RepID=UPI003A8B4D6D
MRTLAAGNKSPRAQVSGFTLLELLMVVALIAVASAGVSFSLQGSAESALERDAERLATLLETGRAQSRANGTPVVWRSMPRGAAQAFVFEGLPPPGLPSHWLVDSTRVASQVSVTLGPEPLIAPQAIALSSATRPERQVWVVTDGLRPFKVQNSPEVTRP